MKRYPTILHAARDATWCIQEPKLVEILGFLDSKAAGMSLDGRAVRSMAAANRAERQASVMRSVAVLPILGTISQRMDLLMESSGGASTERLGKEFDRLLADQEVGAIVFDVDSPGGVIYGIPELADKIFAARGQKPIVAVANSYMASGAYWLGAAADEVVVTPSGDVGSIGVVAVHTDLSKANEEMGVRYTYVTYGKYKAEWNEDEPLSDEALAEIQRRVDNDGEMFALAIARFRGVTPAVVRDKFGQGRTFQAKEAVDRGLADRVDTLENTVARLAGNRPAKRKGTSVHHHRLALQEFGT